MQDSGFLVLLTALLIAAVLLSRPLWRRYRRESIRKQTMPDTWHPIFEQTLAIYPNMPQPLRERLRGLTQQFIAEKEFVGCNGLSVTEPMKLIIATQACLLILNRPGHLYDDLYSILLYPDAFIVPEEEIDEAGVITQHRNALSGQAWETHKIILSWEDIRTARGNPDEPYNVILHEFAHYLDAEDGDPNGAPFLEDSASYKRWSDVMNAEYEQLKNAAERQLPTLLDPYGAEDPAEFFAVATEVFFEKPAALKQLHPALYAELNTYYRLDPAAWA